jgi:hypothetical protein
LGLIVTLVFLFWLRGVMSGWHYVLTGDPGSLLYATTFDEFTEDWAQYDGRLQAQISEGVLRISAATAQSGPFSETYQHFGDFDLSISAKAVEGSLNNAYGVIFRLQDQNNSIPADDSYYLFLISSDGYYQVRRVINGDSKEVSTWIPSEVILQGAGEDAPVNRLRVIAQGERFQFLVNDTLLSLCIPNQPEAHSTYNDLTGECHDGQMLTTFTDASIANGQIGVVVQTLSEPNVTVEFDNLVVWMPEGLVGETVSTEADES